jgi:Spy/CpxP family protein refolding chaperone
MLYVRVGVVVLALVALLGVVSAQDKDKDKSTKDQKDKTTKDGKTPDKVRGQLPAYYKKLGLRDDQTQKIYRLRADYKSKVDALKKKIEQLRTDEREDLEKVLTPEQLKRLRELRASGGK